MRDMKYGKSGGADGLSKEHLKLADAQLIELLNLLISAMLVHSHVSQALTTVIIDSQ